MEKELISIIMPVYNAEKYLDRAINSVINQTYTNWELICINDASTDGSLKILEKYKSHKIKVESLPKNSGTATARNLALKMAKGRFIAFLDADDYYHEKKLEKQIEFMKSNNYAFTFTSYAFVKKSGAIKNVNVPKELDYKNYIKNTLLTTVGVMIDTEKINKNSLNMENYKLAEDTRTWIKILKQGEIAYGLNEVLAYYTQNPTSKSYNKIKAACAVWKVYRNELPAIKVLWYFSCYAVNAIKKRFI